MALIDKDKKVIANLGSKVVTFNTATDFNSWKAKLKNPTEDIKKFIIIKNYSLVSSAKIIGLIVKNKDFGIHKLPGPFVISSDSELTVTPKWTNIGTMQYSIDNGATWININSEEITTSAKVISFRGNMTTNTLYISLEDSGSWKIRSNSPVKISGDITTLLKPMGGIDTLANFAFCRMFSGCLVLEDISNLILPSNILGSSCYRYMFESCESLVYSLEELPAMTLTPNCYSDMFNLCISLKTTPRLPAINLSIDCYFRMFGTCTSLVIPPKLPATILPYQCYYWMFQDCTSLITTPDLSAHTLDKFCYGKMFFGCSSLSNILGTANFTNYEGYNCHEMFDKTPFGLFSKTFSEAYPIEFKNISKYDISRFSAHGNLVRSASIYVRKPQ